MALQQPGAKVPAKNSVVVPRRTNRFGFREAVHRLHEKWSKRVRRAPYAHLCFRPPFMQQVTHSDIARTFVETHDDFVRIYDMENATGVWIAGKRWQLGDPGDALLRVAIRRYLDELFERYGAQQRADAEKKENRWLLRHAAFVSGVLSEVNHRGKKTAR
jgi:hypothetical protein